MDTKMTAAEASPGEWSTWIQPDTVPPVAAREHHNRVGTGRYPGVNPLRHQRRIHLGAMGEGRGEGLVTHRPWQVEDGLLDDGEIPKENLEPKVVCRVSEVRVNFIRRNVKLKDSNS